MQRQFKSILENNKLQSIAAARFCGCLHRLRRRWLNLEACHGAAKPAVPFRAVVFFTSRCTRQLRLDASSIP
eukprot:scaffold6887_cov102-Skeletonema_dohrnii-CCMP3373.AAC.2